MSILRTADAARGSVAESRSTSSETAQAAGEADVRRGPVRSAWSLVAVIVAIAPTLFVLSRQEQVLWPSVVLGVWTVAAVARSFGGREVTLRELLAADLKMLAGLCAVAALSSVAGLVPLGAGRGCIAVLVTAGAVTMVLRLLQPHSTAVRTVVLVSGRAEAASYLQSGRTDQRVAGCLVVDVDHDDPVFEPSWLVPTVTSLEDLSQIVTSSSADEVLVLPGASVDATLVRELSWMFEKSNITLGIVHPVSSVSTHRMRTRVSSHDTVTLLSVPRATSPARLVKAVVDRLGATVLLALAVPLLTALWVAVRLDSRGPAFFVQTRVGRDGQTFRMFKLRSMHLDAESLLMSLVEENESDGVLFKIRRDPRVTRVGYWLRRFSLDELPQLVNVIAGQMSLVGPRPALPAEVANYDVVARRRLVVKPGITGLWQVSGRSDLSWEESLIFDLYYTDNWRLRDDFTIAARTLAAVVRARGAY